MSDPELIRGEDVTLLPVPPGASLDALEQLTAGRAAGRGWPHTDTGAGLAFAASGGWTWLIVDADGTVVGECGTKTPPWAGTVEIGYGLAAPSRGHGLGTRAVHALTTWLASRPDVQRVEAYVATDNRPSRALLERLGFAIDRLEADEVVYARDFTGEAPPPTGKVTLSDDNS